jgi:hypothetical protein
MLLARRKRLKASFLGSFRSLNKSDLSPKGRDLVPNDQPLAPSPALFA